MVSRWVCVKVSWDVYCLPVGGACLHSSGKEAVPVLVDLSNLFREEIKNLSKEEPEDLFNQF